MLKRKYEMTLEKRVESNKELSQGRGKLIYRKEEGSGIDRNERFQRYIEKLNFIVTSTWHWGGS